MKKLYSILIGHIRLIPDPLNKVNIGPDTDPADHIGASLLVDQNWLINLKALKCYLHHLKVSKKHGISVKLS